MKPLTSHALARAAVGCGSCDRTPVEEEPGGAAPRVEGASYYWTTPSGKTVVRYPSAYKWPTRYHSSTRRVVVGVDWLAAADGLRSRRYDDVRRLFARVGTMTGRAAP